MTDKAAVVYPHRRKMDGSSDSICLNCLGTIARDEDWDDDATDFDVSHNCIPALKRKLSAAPQYSA
jgi:hypothetical protein